MFNTPIVINNFNRLTTTKKLCEDLTKLGYSQVIILDNASTYPPLLKWYDECPYRIVRLNNNLGQLSIYNSGLINEWAQGSWVAYSDSDIGLNYETPTSFIEDMANAANRFGFSKIGLALRIDDLPDTPYANWARLWEAKFWENKLDEDLYIAHVDTTFSLIKVGLPFQYEALRIAGKMTAIHEPWYLNYDNLSEEEKYIVSHSDSAYSTTKRFVNTFHS